MYLFLFADGRTRQVHDNLSMADLLAIKEKLLRVFIVKEDKFYELIIDKAKLYPVPLAEGNILQNVDGRLHHP